MKPSHISEDKKIAERRKGRGRWTKERGGERPTTPPKNSPINITGYLHPTFLCAFAQPERGVVETVFKPFVELYVQRKPVSVEVLLLVYVASAVL